MSLRYGIFCLLLFFIVLLLALKNYEIWTYPFEWAPDKGVVKKSEKKEAPPMVGDQKKTTSPESYISIAEKNIFTAERKDFPVILPLTEAPKKPLVRPQIILYGVATTGDYQSASVSIAGSPLKKGEREVMTLRIGEQVGEYKLTKVLPDRITMEAPEDMFEVLLYDPKMPKKRAQIKTENIPTAVTKTPPTPAPPSAGAPKPTPPQAAGTPGGSVPQVQRPSSPTPSPAPTPFPRLRGRRTPMTPPTSPTAEEREED